MGAPLAHWLAHRLAQALAHRLARGLACAALLMLARCGGGGPAEAFPPLSYGYLLPLRLNVASVEVNDSWVPVPGTADVSALSPVTPRDALRQMGQDRLVAAGTGGRAVLHIDDAGIHRVGDALQGHVAVTLDIFAAGGLRAGYAQAEVSRSTTDLQAGLPATLYRLTRSMVDDMNVELEFQIRRSLRAWLLETSQAPSAVAAPVTQQPLGVPGAAPPEAAPYTPDALVPVTPPPPFLPELPGSSMPAEMPAEPSVAPVPLQTPTTPAAAQPAQVPAPPPVAPATPRARYIPGMPPSAPLPGPSSLGGYEPPAATPPMPQQDY